MVSVTSTTPTTASPGILPSAPLSQSSVPEGARATARCRPAPHHQILRSTPSHTAVLDRVVDGPRWDVGANGATAAAEDVVSTPTMRTVTAIHRAATPRKVAGATMSVSPTATLSKAIRRGETSATTVTRSTTARQTGRSPISLSLLATRYHVNRHNPLPHRLRFLHQHLHSDQFLHDDRPCQTDPPRSAEQAPSRPKLGQKTNSRCPQPPKPLCRQTIIHPRNRSAAAWLARPYRPVHASRNLSHPNPSDLLVSSGIAAAARDRVLPSRLLSSPPSLGASRFSCRHTHGPRPRVLARPAQSTRASGLTAAMQSRTCTPTPTWVTLISRASPARSPRIHRRRHARLQRRRPRRTWHRGKRPSRTGSQTRNQPEYLPARRLCREMDHCRAMVLCQETDLTPGMAPFRGTGPIHETVPTPQF